MNVEGMEDRVLCGFSEMLKRQRRATRVIQFEYGRVNIESFPAEILLMDAVPAVCGSCRTDE